MGRVLLMLTGLLALAALAWLCIDHHAQAIERDLSDRASLSLAGAGLGELDVALDGRDVTLSGTVADNSERARAVDLARDVYGVRSVRDRLMVPALAPAEPTPEPTPEPAPEPAPKDRSPAADPVVAIKAAAVSCQARFDEALAGETVQFESGAATLKAASFELLGRLAQIAATCPEASLEIRGHTDSQGAAAANLRLSEQRAAAVRDDLAARGVSAERLTARGLGEEAPVADNATAAGRAANRRVEIIVEGV